MKKVFIVAGALMFSVLAVGQTVSEKVNEAFSTEEIQQMKAEDPETLDYLSFYADNVYVYNESAKKSEGLDDISTLKPKSEDIPELTAENFDPETFNPLLYDIELDDKKLQYYKIGNTGSMIMIYSNMRFDVLFNRHQVNTSK